MKPEQLDELKEVIDVNDLINRCLGNLEFAERILCVFETRCASDLQELETAIENEDLEDTERLAHRFKGACANAAAFGLHERATELWQAANQRSPDAVSDCFQNLQEEWTQTVATLSKDRTPVAT